MKEIILRDERFFDFKDTFNVPIKYYDNNISTEEFATHLMTNTPFIVKYIVKEWPAFEKW